MAMTEKKVVEKRLNFLKKALKDKQIELLIEPLRSAYIQGVLSRGRPPRRRPPGQGP